MRVRFPIILSLMLVAFLTAGAATQRTYFIGAIDGQSRVQMDLTVLSTHAATGTYYYESTCTPLTLRGKVNGRAVTLEEVNGAGKRVATLTGQLTASSPARITGTWSSVNGKKNLTLALTAVATYRFRTAKKGTTTVTAAYPQFLRAIPPLQRLNKRLALIAQYAQTAFIDHAAHARDPKGAPGWSQDFRYSISYYADDLLSMLVTDDEYSGGAHGNTGYRGEQYVVNNGIIRLFTLDEIFKPKSDYISALSKHLVAELRRQDAGWIADKTVTNFKANDLRIFTFTPKTLNFVFPPYAVGPYSQGSFFAPIPFKALEGHLNNQGPLARFFTALGEST
ncbi:MAG TPA: DUF3298 domain-containing protein [Armatimonadota bacterium]